MKRVVDLTNIFAQPGQGFYQPPPKPELSLLPSQYDHFKRTVEILQNFFVAIDVSETGAGKTYVAAAVAMSLGLPFLVVGKSPDPWNKLQAQLNGNGADGRPLYQGYFTYGKMRGTTHGFLTKYTNEFVTEGGKTIKSVTFQVTQKWLQ